MLCSGDNASARSPLCWEFFFSLFAALIGYILLPYLSTFMPAAYTGLVIAGGALAALILFPFLPVLVERFGVQRLALVFACVEAVALFILATAPSAWTASLLIALAVSLQPILSYELDLLLEATVAEEGTTGRVRTLFITAWNIAALTAPLLMGALLADSDAYGACFLPSAPPWCLSLFSLQFGAFRKAHQSNLPICVTHLSAF